jgi:two-component system, response regulator YesN
MYNVMIVDDEPVIRFGLKASVNWEQKGLHLIGDFPNGEVAFQAMQTHHVDILITDIKMPVMDGLTLMKKALERFPNLKVILVSSYNDFEFVREGLMYGAVDYVLKPTLEPEEFLQLIQKCVKKIHEEEEIEEKLSLVDQTSMLKERKRLEQEIKRVLLHEKDDIEYEGKFNGPFTVVFMKMKHVEKIEERFGFLYKSLILDEVQEQFYIDYEEGICFPIGETNMLFFIRKEENPKNTVAKLKQKFESETNVHFSFGYDVISTLTEVESGFKRSLSACNRSFFNEQKDIFKYEQPKQQYLKRLKTDQLKQFLLPYDKQKVTHFLQERYQQWKREEMAPADIKDEACDILTHLFVNKLDVSLLIEKCSRLKNTESLNELYHLLLKLIEQCDRLIVQMKEKPTADNELMEKALEYIHEHYTEELTLQRVASHIHISRNYFSILFKRFLNQNFIDYVIDLRIKKAKELLLHTPLKVYEVAENAGFKDVKYFSKLFKKITGFSPGDFRTEHQKS